jgi:hypothetical protein
MLRELEEKQMISKSADLSHKVEDEIINDGIEVVR